MSSIRVIPTPDMTILRPLARITYWDQRFMEVFWSPETHQVLYHPTKTRIDGRDVWYSSYNTNIVASLAFFFRGRVQQIVVDRIRVFDQMEQEGRIQDLLSFYDWNWTKYADEQQIVHFNFRVFNWIKDEEERRETTNECDLISTWQMTGDATYETLIQKIRIAKMEADANTRVYSENYERT